MTTKFKINFTLDDSDLAFFKGLFRKARAEASRRDPADVIKVVRDLIGRVQHTKKTPTIVSEAARTLHDLIEMLEDEDYGVPKRVASEVIGALAYFADPQDLIPDDVPGLGFLDDAIMIKILESEFRHELAGYRKFRRFREGAEQRPWTSVAKARLPHRLAEQRKKIREEVERRKREDRQKREHPHSWW